MESLGGFIDPSLSTPRSTTPSNPIPSTTTSTSNTSSSESTTSAPERRDSESTTLNLDKEVQNVIAGFGSFWGKVRKQSTAAFFTAEKQLESTRKDLNPLLSKARANLDTFSTAARAEVQRLSEVQQLSSSGGGGVVIGADGLPMIIGPSEEEEQELRRKEKGKGVDRSESTTSQSQENPAAAASAFFTKLQSQLSSVQDQAPAALHSLSSNFTQFQDQLSHLNLKDLKNPAESYLHKGEAWLGEFQKEVSKLAKEAVTIVPPSLSGQAAEEVRPSRKSEDSFRGMTRKDGLLFRLRSDPAIFLIDPSLPPLPSSNDLTDLRDAYSTFLSTLPQDLLQSEMVQEAQEDGGEVLEKTRKEVVSSEEDGARENALCEEIFWKRYLFRVSLIEAEEEKRKKVLNVAQSEEDDFTWDLDEEESLASASQATSPPPSSTTTFPPASLPPAPTSTSTTPTRLPSTQPQTPSTSATSTETPSSFAQSKPPISPTSTGSIEGSPPALIEPSPRNSSSEDGESRGTRTSYDFVGERSGNPSIDGEGADREEETALAGKEGKKVVGEKKEEEDSEDSDWE